MPQITYRVIPEASAKQLVQSGYPGTLAKIFAARGIAAAAQLETTFAQLLPFNDLKNAQEMACLLADAIRDRQRILVIADYDADGATACTVAVRGLRAFGAEVDFIVPNRFEYGYGLTPEIVQLAALRKPDILLTVDNGIASVDGVRTANALGMRVFVTDHHLPGDTLPEAACIVNPNQPGCTFPCKNLAGVGVMFYVLLALRAELRKRGEMPEERGRKLLELLDLVALGTVADVVKLDQNNRILVHQGLQRIRAGRGSPGINALLQVAKKSPAKVSSTDMGFTVGPRLNAAGRLDDMSLGINCLLTDDAARALQIAGELDTLNRERRSIETDMQDSALASLESINPQSGYSLVLFDPNWHQGVIGILASRLKDRFHRPVIAFAQASEGELKGSGRSIAGLHLRDALDLVSKRHPALIRKFGGHAAAAGLSIAELDFEAFVTAFEQVASELLDERDLEQRIETDGELDSDGMTLEMARLLEEQVWGQGFPAPQFCDNFEVLSQRVVGEKHLKLRLAKDGNLVEAIFFGHADPLPDRIRIVYSLGVNEYNGSQTLQLLVRHWQHPPGN
ncbi:MAG: single-stranded-DNA-specific exonuclease RecJ [Gallionella sp.]|nr:single-stranded-DNA-specific exonuclease RecJ [Gallionella sp.]MDD4946840.1 single-stranded-DNA-specific exonuclease RecJ [Gallionella sp.]MDD5613235.1 single-stranded-DNA-specific exonuclease RecJ [Gallionella sp.]